MRRQAIWLIGGYIIVKMFISPQVDLQSQDNYIENPAHLSAANDEVFLKFILKGKEELPNDLNKKNIVGEFSVHDF